MTAPTSGFRTFTIVWSGQLVSLVGANLSGFALGVYVYWQTNSVTLLGFMFALNLLPSIIASPFAGALVDRWGTRRALIVGNLAAIAVVSVLAGLMVTDTFAVWHVYGVVAALSVTSALRFPAFAALVPQLVPKRQLGRANGMRTLAMAASEVLAPVSAGFLLLAIGLRGIVLLNLVSFGLALLTLLLVRIPQLPSARPAAVVGGSPQSLLTEFRQGWYYIAARRGLLALLVFLGAVNFSAGFIDLLLAPLVLAFASAGALGTILSIGGVGMIIASLVVTAWGGPRRRVRGVLGFSIVLALAAVLGASRPSVALIAIAAFVFMGALAVIISTNMTIWQTKVEPGMLGRAMAIVNIVGSIPQLLAYLLAGVAADRVFQPLVGEEEVRSSALAALIGTGPGRGIALLMMVMGVLIALFVAVAAMNPRLRHLEQELPDVAPDADGSANGDPATDDTAKDDTETGSSTQSDEPAPAKA